jgi:NADH dehydrogenase (ubiquinone) Fe-S protein 4
MIIRNSIRFFTSGPLPQVISGKETGTLEEINTKLKAIGVPQDISSQRRVVIFKPTRSVMQAGKSQTKHWQLKFNTTNKWQNPLIGWTSSSDAVQALYLHFATKEEAIKYAQDQGLTYKVEEPKESLTKPKSYSSNFTYSNGKLKIIKTK